MSRRLKILIASLIVALVLGGAYLARRAVVVAEAGADSLAGKELELAPVFEDVSLTTPVWMAQPPGTPGRWYVVEQTGRIVTFRAHPQRRDRRVALDITDRVKFGGEQGLLGLAFHPRFRENGYVFVNYTSTQSGRRETRISRFQRAADGVSFEPTSEKIILRVGQPYSNHNGGGLLFGPDGLLYIGFGDGGLAGDPDSHGQNTRTLLGSFVRIDVDSKDPYAIPADNPFADGEDGAPEIYAWGLRNPWRFSFDAKTGELWAGDVGQNDWEELSIIERGKNYGWAVYEGSHCYDPPLHLRVFGSGKCGEAKGAFEPPVLDYSQRLGDKSVTGGYVYRGRKIPSLQGKYVYADFVSGRIFSFDPTTRHNRLLLDTPLAIASFVEAHDGELGVLSYSDGRIYHLRRP